MVDSKKRSLGLARQFRMCPPRDVASNPVYEEEMKRHLSICPYCSMVQPEDTSSWDELAENLRSLAVSEGASMARTEPGKGSVCLINQERGGWGDGYFYNPPAVLILETNVSDEVLVAQTYHDVALAGPGDLILEGDRAPVGEIFIEPWNTYTLRLRDLERPLCRLENSIVEAVTALDADPTAYPEWALLPRPMAHEDPRIYFREMEVEVGYVFSSAAVSDLLKELEGPSLRLAYGSAGELVSEVMARVPGAQWQHAPQTVEQALATLQFPPERYAMAAESEDRELFPANFVTVRARRVEHIEPIEGEILERTQEPDGLAIGGRIFTPEGFEISNVLCFLDTGEGEFISSEGIVSCDSTGLFHTRFPVSFSRGMELFVAAIHEATDE
ncbi:MAG: hypothetical protein PHS17_01625 [Desulfobacterales bacterium]|nr:hypothetical protein [Desulfobacterales bacterium]